MSSSSKPFAGAESGSPGRALEAGKRGSPGRAVQAGIRGKRLNAHATIVYTSKEPMCPRVELILKITIILLIIFLGFIKSKPC